MATATVVKVWKDNNCAYMAAYVDEGGHMGRVEYIGSTPLLDDDSKPKNDKQLRAHLAAAVKAKRDAQIVEPSSLPIAGTVTI